MTIASYFRTKLREARKKAKLTQVQLAKRSGMTSKHISELERGVKKPSFAAAQALAKALGVTVADFNGPNTKAPSKKAKRRKKINPNPSVTLPLGRRKAPVRRSCSQTLSASHPGMNIIPALA